MCLWPPDCKKPILVRLMKLVSLPAIFMQSSSDIPRMLLEGKLQRSGGERPHVLSLLLRRRPDGSVISGCIPQALTLFTLKFCWMAVVQLISPQCSEIPEQRIKCHCGGDNTLVQHNVNPKQQRATAELNFSRKERSWSFCLCRDLWI